MKLAAAAALALAFAGAAPAAPPEYFGRPALGGQPLPFSDAVRVGDTLYLSGQLGLVDGRIPDSFEAEAKAAMDNIGTILKARGLTHDDLFKCLVMLDDMANWPAFNKVYMPYFKAGRMPARSAFGADGLALGARLEVECIAYAGPK
jgi:2-iminobutanoate/2-iminopropanoate deaminase